MVGAALYLASRITAKAISGLLLFARYISALMTLRYGYSEPNTSYPFGVAKMIQYPFLRLLRPCEF
jgi:hypothetical protein